MIEIVQSTSSLDTNPEIKEKSSEQAIYTVIENDDSESYENNAVAPQANEYGQYYPENDYLSQAYINSSSSSNPSCSNHHQLPDIAS